MRLLAYSHKNNIKTFWYYSHNILIRLLRSKKDRLNICYFWRQFIENEWKKQSPVMFELDKHRKEEAWLQKRENFDTHTVVRGLLILASLKFESRNTIKSTKSNLKKEELKAVVHRCS